MHIIRFDTSPSAKQHIHVTSPLTAKHEQYNLKTAHDLDSYLHCILLQQSALTRANAGSYENSTTNITLLLHCTMAALLYPKYSNHIAGHSRRASRLPNYSSSKHTIISYELSKHTIISYELTPLRVRTHQQSQGDSNPAESDSRVKGCSH